MKLVVGNQKSYLDKIKMNDFIKGIKKIDSKTFILCPSSIYFSELSDYNILLGSQNVSNYDSGAATGELSCEQLKSMGVYFSIVGHSERREKFNESIEDTNVKIKKLLENNMIPILCVGETKKEKDNNQTKKIIEEELKGALKDLDNDLIEKIIIAYEPIWSIGTGNIPSNDEIEEISKYIRNLVKENYNCSNILLYGGSVNVKNVDELNLIDIIDGYLIGGASTKIDELIEIIDKCK